MLFEQVRRRCTWVQCVVDASIQTVKVRRRVHCIKYFISNRKICSREIRRDSAENSNEKPKTNIKRKSPSAPFPSSLASRRRPKSLKLYLLNKMEILVVKKNRLACRDEWMAAATAYFPVYSNNNYRLSPSYRHHRIFRQPRVVYQLSTWITTVLRHILVFYRARSVKMIPVETSNDTSVILPVPNKVPMP